MSENRRRFTRKSRSQLDAAERDRLIAEITGKAAPHAPPKDESPTPKAPSTAPESAPSELDVPDLAPSETDAPWQPDLDPGLTSGLAAEEEFAAADTTPEIEPDVPDIDEDFLAEVNPEPDPHPIPSMNTPPKPEVEREPTPDAEPVVEDPQVLDAKTEVADDPVPYPDSEPLVDSTPKAPPPVMARIPRVAQSAPDTPVDPAPERMAKPTDSWDRLGSIAVDPAHLERNLIITAGRHDPAHGAFDVLRTRLVQTLYDNDWKRVAITSPTRDCGKTFTAVNLAISLSRYESMRTVLMDMDMRNPSVASVLGATAPGAMGDFLTGETSLEQHFLRLGRNALNIGNNLAVGLNDRIEPFAAELIQDPRSEIAFDAVMQGLDPDVVLYDLPPALAYDDVIAFRKYFDGVLMVVGGGSTKADEVHEAMRRLGEDLPLLGVVLNQAETEVGKGYSYGY